MKLGEKKVKQLRRNKRTLGKESERKKRRSDQKRERLVREVIRGLVV